VEFDQRIRNQFHVRVNEFLTIDVTEKESAAFWRWRCSSIRNTVGRTRPLVIAATV
jgi:hypothetical protein